MPVLVQDVVRAVINELSQVPGVATQLYASGRIQQHVQDAFLLEFEDMLWPDYMTHIGPIPIDGETGQLSQDLVGPLGKITEYRDIAAVWQTGRSVKLKELPQSINPTTLTATGGYAVFMSPDYTTPSRPFRVWPKGATEDVVIWAKQRPTLPLNLTDKLYIDGLLLQYDATWMYCVDDGTVPAQVNKFQVLATNRRKAVKANYAQQPLELDPRMPMDGIQDSFFILDKTGLA